MYVQGKIEPLSCKQFCSGEAMSVKLPDCAFVALGIQHGMRMCITLIRGLHGCTIFFHLISQRHYFSKETPKRLHRKCVLVFTLQLLSETFIAPFEKLRKAAIRILMSLRLYPWNNSAPTGRIFMKF